MAAPPGGSICEAELIPVHSMAGNVAAIPCTAAHPINIRPILLWGIILVSLLLGVGFRAPRSGLSPSGRGRGNISWGKIPLLI